MYDIYIYSGSSAKPICCARGSVEILVGTRVDRHWRPVFQSFLNQVWQCAENLLHNRPYLHVVDIERS
jgi:hypothetical protein